MTRTHYVYRAFDANGALLYVGCTKTPDRRIAQHSTDRRAARWYPLVESLRLQGPYEHHQALQIERAAIEDEQPKFNKQHAKAAA